MLQCGLLIPLHESSRTGLFSRMFIDIGDEQSIENDLSTYSSHLMNMKFFVKNCDERTILLIDEFGSGTEPQIGGAIAEALLDRFNRNGSFGVITTHYQNLKHFAEETDGIVNGAMLYDRHLMRPLFTLSIGNPGSSFAIEIARKIGLPEEVIADASEKVGADYINMDKYLQDIVRDKRYWENKRQNVRQQEKRLEEITARYEKELAAINQQRKEIIQEAKNEAERLLTESNAKIENTIREIREAQADKEQTKLARQSLQEFKTGISATQDENEKLAREMAKIKARNERKNKRAKEEKPKGFDKETIREGDLVRLKGQTSAGNVLSIDGKQAVVAFGMIKSTLKLDQLEKVSNNQIKKEMPKSTFISEKTRDEMHEKKLHFKQEIDVRGMRGDEALQTVTYFIDDAMGRRGVANRYLFYRRRHTSRRVKGADPARDGQWHLAPADTRLPEYRSGRTPLSRRACPVWRGGHHGGRTRLNLKDIQDHETKRRDKEEKTHLQPETLGEVLLRRRGKDRHGAPPYAIRRAQPDEQDHRPIRHLLQETDQPEPHQLAGGQRTDQR